MNRRNVPFRRFFIPRISGFEFKRGKAMLGGDEIYSGDSDVRIVRAGDRLGHPADVARQAVAVHRRVAGVRRPVRQARLQVALKTTGGGFVLTVPLGKFCRSKGDSLGGRHGKFLLHGGFNRSPART